MLLFFYYVYELFYSSLLQFFVAPVYGEGTDHVTPEKETLPGINSPKTDPELTLSCSVFMLDIILRQVSI